MTIHENDEMLTESSTFLRLSGVEELVRRGMMSIDRLPFLRSALVKTDQNMFLPFIERDVYYSFVRELLNTVFGDPTIKRLVLNRVAMRRYESFDPSSINEDVDLRKMPETMLSVLAKMVMNKKRAGGKPTEADRTMVTRAKAEIRRRRLLAMRGSMREENNHQKIVEQALTKLGVNSVSELSTEQFTDFVAMVDASNATHGE
jgi:hypothetical protein